MVEHLFKRGTLVPVLFEQLYVEGLAEGILTGYEFFALLGDLGPRVEREVRGVVDSLPGDLAVIFVVVGEHAGQEEVDDDSQRPEIDFFAVGLLKQNFRSNVGLDQVNKKIRMTYKSPERIERSFRWTNDFRETEVHNLQIALVRIVNHQDVFRL